MRCKRLKHITIVRIECTTLSVNKSISHNRLDNSIVFSVNGFSLGSILRDALKLGIMEPHNEQRLYRLFEQVKSVTITIVDPNGKVTEETFTEFEEARNTISSYESSDDYEVYF